MKLDEASYFLMLYVIYFMLSFFQQDGVRGAGGAKWGNAAEMTEEEAAAEQQRMFAEARARMNGSVPLPKQSDTDPTPQS